MTDPTTPSRKSDQTRKAIRQAMLRIEKGRTRIVDKGRKMSIAAVAEETGISRAAIHRLYPDFAEKIREFYDVHQNSIDKVNTYRRLQTVFGGIYLGLATYETVATIHNHLEYQKLISQIEGLGEEIESAQINLEMEDQAVLAKIHLRF